MKREEVKIGDTVWQNALSNSDDPETWAIPRTITNDCALEVMTKEEYWGELFFGSKEEAIDIIGYRRKLNSSLKWKSGVGSGYVKVEDDEYPDIELVEENPEFYYQTQGWEIHPNHGKNTHGTKTRR